MRRQDVAFFVAVWALVSFISGLVRLDLWNAAAWAVVAIAAGAVAQYWSAKYPGPMPHTLRWLLHLPRPGHSARALARALDLGATERVLEIGPGIGVHSLPIAGLLSAGKLDVLDIQRPMLVDLMARARKRGLTNIVPTQADAQRLPYADAAFDAAYVMTALGEIPSMAQALGELRRVLRGGGRLVIGEFFLDPDYVPPARLAQKLTAAGFVFVEQLGPAPAYLACFATPPSTSGQLGLGRAARGANESVARC